MRTGSYSLALRANHTTLQLPLTDFTPRRGNSRGKNASAKNGRRSGINENIKVG